MHLQICIFRPLGVLKSKKFQKKPTLKFNFTLKNMWASSCNFKLTFRLKSHWALLHIIIELCCCFSSCCWAPQLVELVTLLGKQHRLSCNVFLTLAMAFLLFYSCTISCNVFSTILLLCCIFYSTISCHVFCYTGVTPLMSSVRLTSAADSSNTSC